MNNLKSRPSIPIPQHAPGSSAAIGHNVENSIPLSIFPIAADKICICFCGLPARGKSHVSRRLGRYLSFFHAMPVKIFNATEYRRNMYGATRDANWFDPYNADTKSKRAECNKKILDEMVGYLEQNDTAVVILDSTNPTHERRKALMKSMT